jgi:hypothetical protein
MMVLLVLEILESLCLMFEYRAGKGRGKKILLIFSLSLSSFPTLYENRKKEV